MLQGAVHPLHRRQVDASIRIDPHLAVLVGGCAAHSKNWAVRLEVSRLPSCSTTSGAKTGQAASAPSST